uniref:Arabinogalactan endo-beta-1,4-galactanase n=1 Tax=Globodera pallida TaxID=36090 RepID=A0A183C872_GLOPA
MQAGFDATKDFAVVNVEIFKNEGSDKDAFTEKLVDYVKLLKSKVPNVVIHANSDQWSMLVNSEHDDFFAQFPLSVIDYDNQQVPTLPRPWTIWQRWLHTREVPVNGISGPVWLSRVNCSVKKMPGIF